MLNIWNFIYIIFYCWKRIRRYYRRVQTTTIWFIANKNKRNKLKKTLSHTHISWSRKIFSLWCSGYGTFHFYLSFVCYCGFHSSSQSNVTKINASEFRCLIWFVEKGETQKIDDDKVMEERKCFILFLLLFYGLIAKMRTKKIKLQDQWKNSNENNLEQPQTFA